MRKVTNLGLEKGRMMGDLREKRMVRVEHDGNFSKKEEENFIELN